MKFINEFTSYKDNLTISESSVTFFGSARFKPDNKYCIKAKELAFMLSENGINIITGGGDGIMGAANEGAHKSKKSQSIGFNIKLPFEQQINNFTSYSFIFSNFLPRKFALIEHSKAFVVFPGGFGTLDELFEVLVLSQTKLKKAKIFLYGVDFWKKLDVFIKTTLLNEKAIDTNSLELYKITDDLDFIKNKILNI
ncbi:TIGR00730 family Rossman fold protein [Campylobacter pinnipediorum]|uniref:LOG family protein n=1 Tax=Campylobacter pinnipediorum TaxID=1965231 RepID=UPI00084DCFC4|nr:TIGR00730 family Rossman fold protein [Campylobacter pinnipediorum]